jgi:hypothetical protein
MLFRRTSDFRGLNTELGWELILFYKMGISISLPLHDVHETSAHSDGPVCPHVSSQEPLGGF